ncbi:MAG TPA: MTH938/NDUFAF3 family protein [Xanthomonadales bacterium]|nr:MTH938/NDUFAF3 family protein [Xanthomonadales bacterium]
MQLTQQPFGAGLFIRRAGAQAIVVVDRELVRSFALSPERVLEDWPPASAAAIDAAAMAALLALEPAVVLLGTGARLARPPASALAPLLTRGIGCEVMDNAAAARTFNVLASEGRKVVAAFVLPAA